MKSPLPMAITMGDPAGIGPEIVVKALARAEVKRLGSYLVIGSHSILRDTARALGLRAAWRASADYSYLRRSRALVRVLDIGPRGKKQIVPGRVSAKAGEASAAYVRQAALLALAGEVAGIVTAPINKEALTKAGHRYQGHTEILGGLTKTRRPVMLMMGGGLRMAQVTTHVAINRLSRAITRARVLSTIRTTHGGLRELFGIVSPRIGVCGLNPHAGEHGKVGTEEPTAILPAIEQARKEGIDCVGPLPADTACYYARKGKYDALVVMYHDQANIPVKLLAFEAGVNVTLGLPFVRTSPGHGTAYDIVGKNVARPTSFVQAIKTAWQLSRRRAKRG